MTESATERPLGRPRARRGQRSLLRASRFVLGGLAIVLLLCVVGGARGVLSLTDSRTDLSDQLDPAARSVEALRAAAYLQQNAVRGYALTADPTFLDPWNQGRADAAARITDLRARLDGYPGGLALVDEVERALGDWQQGSAMALIEAVDEGGDVPPGTVVASRAAFERLQAAVDDLAEDVDARRSVARRDLDAAADRLVRTLVLATVALAVSLLGIWLAVRRLVVRPLASLVDDTRRIVDGDLEHVPRASGSSEFRELAGSVDAVRAALVAQLRAGEAREADLARSNAELEQFAYVASHDLQEPLRKVASFCQMLERRYAGQLDERADQYISFAVDGAKRMQDLINDLLAFSRVGRTTERFVPVDLDDALDRALRNLSTGISEAGATIDHEPLPTVDGDRTLLVALFQNLVGNAIKFRSEEPPRVHITTRDLGDHVEVSVSDNGIGIPEEYRDRIFVIFQRLHGRDEYAGTGIGLALCRKIVEFHGGRIEVDAHEGPGTTIRFTLQRAHRPAGDDAATEPQELVTP